MRSLDATTYRGMWAAVPTPWNAEGKLDEGALHRNCQRLASAKADGIYTTDSDGEFYAIELEEFRQLANAFSKAMESAGVDAAMGVTWTSTKGIIDRIKASLDAGIPNVHVAFPFFMPVATPDVDRFFADLAAAAPQARWIHYAHPTCQPILSGRDYARIARQFPEQLIGTKLAQAHFTDLTEVLIHSPGLAHSVVDTTMLPGYLMGAVGVCSYWFNTLPRWHRQFHDLCAARQWDLAAVMHKKFMEWEMTHIQKVRVFNHRHGIVGKMRGSFTGFLEDTGRTRAPYHPVAEPLQAELREAFKQYWAAEIRAEGF